MTEQANTGDVITEIVDVLQENLEDPVTSRANQGKTWIYDFFPSDKSMPHIGLHPVAKTYQRKSIGQPDSRELSDIQVTIRSRKNKVFDVDDDGNKEPAYKVNSYLERKVKNLIQDNQSRFRNMECVTHVLPNDSTTLNQPQNNWVGQAITYEIRLGG